MIQPRDLVDQVSIVTGAGRMRSIGRATAVELARAGCDVVLVGTGRSPDRYPDDEKQAGWRDIESVADEVRSLGRRALPLVADVSDPASVEPLVHTIVEAFGRIDVLINNAGSTRGSDRVAVVDMDIGDWRRTIDVNLTGAFLMSKFVGRVLIDQGSGGSIVNISSIAARILGANGSAYAASKAGLQALTGSMAREVAQYGIRVNAVLPGVIDTSRMDDLGRGERWQSLIDSSIPLGRAGTPTEIARLVTYLCSIDGAWITGQNYVIDGGRTIGA